MISVFVPSHITGFFSIFDNENPLLKGSLGAGVLLDKGVITEIYENDDEKGLSISINGKKDEYNEVIILKTIELMDNELNVDEVKFKLENVIINQTIQVPIGCGFGTSAASAIGTAICINEYFNLGLSIEECGQFAHLSEVELGTGLGDVIAELSKGIVLRTKAGAPGFGQARSIVPHEKEGFGVFESLKSDFYVITKSLGEISTASIIQDPKHKKIITQVGLEIGEEFNKKDTHLINDDLLGIVHQLHGKVIGSSMAMLGNTVFAIANENQKLKLEAEYYNEFDFYKMDTEGIRINNLNDD